MKTKLMTSFAMVWMASLLVSRAPAFAHHGNRGAYDIDPAKELTQTGTVTQFKWGNPHVYILYDVKDDTGNVVHWAAETHPPYVMAKSGWTRDTLKPGDPVTVTIFPAKSGTPVALLAKVVFGGKLIYDDEKQRLADGPE